MISITSHRQGAILNHNHGVETEHGLTITVSGISNTGQPVKVNGIPAEMDGQIFHAKIELTRKLNNVVASVMTPYGNFSQELVLVWDKKSFRRCNFFIDDHSFLFTDLARQRPVRAFDHFYLKALKNIHDKYGLKVTLNCFYHNDHHDFDLKDMPGLWKPEFQANSDWLKFSFHSYSEFPDRPYLECDAETFAHDWDLVQNEIIRFAGEEAWINPVVIHWANLHPAVSAELLRRGVTAYHNDMRPRVMGGPSLAERQNGGDMNRAEQRNLSGEDRLTSLDGLKLHYDIPEEKSYSANHSVYYDPALKLFFFYEGCCCNLTPLNEIPAYFEKAFRLGKAAGVECYHADSHEQYSFPCYSNYIPDHLQRLEAATKALVMDGGCTPVFYAQGLLGNTAWSVDCEQ